MILSKAIIHIQIKNDPYKHHTKNLVKLEDKISLINKKVRFIDTTHNHIMVLFITAYQLFFHFSIFYCFKNYIHV